MRSPAQSLLRNAGPLHDICHIIINLKIKYVATLQLTLTGIGRNMVVQQKRGSPFIGAVIRLFIFKSVQKSEG